MNKNTLIYNSYKACQSQNLQSQKDKYSFKVADSLNDMMKIIAIRSAVFVGEQECPYEEEFEGNDFCALHIIGFVGREPAACLRLRFFADFAKFERLAVRHEYRGSTLSFRLARAGIELARKKGYEKIYGQVQDKVVNFWSRFNAKPLENRKELIFSDYSYTEMLITVKPHPEAINLESDPYTLIRVEGAWDEPGILEKSAERKVTSPLRNLKAA